MSINKNKVYNVKNRSASTTVIRIPELGVRKEFAPGESMRMTFDELEKLSFQAGGRELMANFLQIMEDDVNDELGVSREAEYYMNEGQIIELLRTGSLDQFKDCLDFAPIGVIDLVKQFAVSLPLTDTTKIEALREKTGFDVTKAITNKKASDTEEEGAGTAAAGPARRVATNYKVVKTAEPEE